MPLNPRRVQDVFLEAADYHGPADHAAIPGRARSADPPSPARRGTLEGRQQVPQLRQ